MKNILNQNNALYDRFDDDIYELFKKWGILECIYLVILNVHFKNTSYLIVYQLREWDSNPRPSAYETDNLTADISRIQKLTDVSYNFNDLWLLNH